MFGKSSKHFFRVLITTVLIIFGSMLLGHIVVNEIIRDAYEKEFANIAAFSMFIVSFLVAMIAWQGWGVLRILFWVIGLLLTFGHSMMDPPTQGEMPPHSWRMITYAAITCASYGLLIGLLNKDVATWITAFDFLVAGGCWGVLLTILARFGLLPFVDRHEMSV